MKKIRDKVYISNFLWSIIQTVMLLVMVVIFWELGCILALEFQMLDIPFYTTTLGVILWIKLKFWLEDEFSDCIES